MIPKYWSYQTPLSLRSAGSGSARYIRNSGVMMTCGGSRLPAVNSISRTG